MPIMPEEKYTVDQILRKIEQDLPHWKYEEGYIVREFSTKNWKETVMLFKRLF